jgi:hypothetical protein
MSWSSRIVGREPPHGREERCPIRFDLPGWHPQPRPDAASSQWHWNDDAGDTLTVQIEQQSAFADGEASDLRRLRAACRERARQVNASIVQVDPVDVASIPGLMVITKARLRLSASYVGRMMFPLAGPQYVVRIDAIEHGVTGQRDAIALAAMAERGEIVFEPPELAGEPRRIKGWCQDPYDPAFDRDALNFVSGGERLDVVVPKHPLSKIRATLALIRNTTTLEASMSLTSVPRGPAAGAPTLVVAASRPQRSECSAFTQSSSGRVRKRL